MAVAASRIVASRPVRRRWSRGADRACTIAAAYPVSVLYRISVGISVD
jgi:hypothetical protein